MKIKPSNGGVIVRPILSDLDKECPHRLGAVLDAGQGVRWLHCGAIVVYNRADATEFESDYYDTASWEGVKMPPPYLSSPDFNKPKGEWVYLLEQRAILGAIDVSGTEIDSRVRELLA